MMIVIRSFVIAIPVAWVEYRSTGFGGLRVVVEPSEKEVGVGGGGGGDGYVGGGGGRV